jgi:hypothetical protein
MSKLQKDLLKSDYKVALCLDIYKQQSNFINIYLTIVKFYYLNYINIDIILLCKSVCKFELFSISYIKGTNL